MCKVLGISRSSYYDWLSRCASKRSIMNRYLGFKVRKVYKESRGTYSSPRITACLQEEGLQVTRPRVARIMNRLGIRSKLRKRFRVTTNSNHSYALAPNLLDRNFNVSTPSQVWVSDITYIPVQTGWVYLTIIMDLYDRKIIGWSMSERLKTDHTTLSAFQMARRNRSIKNDLIFHSDRGVQYAADLFKKQLAEHKIKQSMSRKGDCWDNAVAENFFKTIKTECVYHQSFENKQQARLELFAYIEYWYNNNRKHSALGYLTPNQKEQLFFKQLNKKIIGSNKIV